MEEIEFKPKKKKSVLKRVIVIILICALVVAGTGAVGLAIYVNRVRGELPNLDIYSFSPDQASQIFDYKGNLITNVYATENRVYVTLDQVSDIAKQAVLEQEDKRFYEHGPLDYKGIVRAVYVTITSFGRRIEGGSTLTQQLARTMFLTTERTLSRKIKEAILAVELEKRFTKNQIFEMYLNQIYFGAGAYGIEQAALTFLGNTQKTSTLPKAQ